MMKMTARQRYENSSGYDSFLQPQEVLGVVVPGEVAEDQAAVVEVSVL